jgi:hypothetical protein
VLNLVVYSFIIARFDFQDLGLVSKASIAAAVMASKPSMVVP